MAEYTTRIQDLPENVTINIPPQFSQSGGKMVDMGGDSNTNYQPLNVHPNPYINGPGVNPQQAPTSVMPLPQQDTNVQQMLSQLKLPSRDIPMNQSQYASDEEIKPNFIPAPKTMTDYIEHYDRENAVKFQEHEKEKKRVKMTESLWNELQIPFFVALLFFIFHMPIINTFMYKYMSFFQIYGSDGNINFNGLFLKSLFFGSVFYGFTQAMKALDEL